MDNYQVVIHIQSQAMKFSNPEVFKDSVEFQRKQGGVDEVGLPVWRKFEHWPLLKIVDERGGGFKAYCYEKLEDLPTESIEGVLIFD